MRREVRMELVIVALAASVTLASRAPLAYADAKAADAAFLKGKELQQKKQYQEACAAFEDSFREDPKIGAQLNVARCYQEWGKTATAHRAYEEALRLAREAKDKRASQIQDLIDELLPAVPVVMISLPPGRLAPEGLTVTVDGQELAHELLGKPRRLDPGPHAVEMRLTGAEPRTLSVTATAKQRSELVLPIDAALAEAASDEPAPPAATGPAAPARGRTRRIAALATGGAGVVALGVASWLALDARSDYQDARDAHCQSGLCDDVGLARTRDARTQGNAATVVGGFAVAMIATGAYLYFTAPRAVEREAPAPEVGRRARTRRATDAALTVRPLLWTDGAGVALGGRL